MCAAQAARAEAHGLAGFQGADTLRRRIDALLGFDATPHLGTVGVPTLVVAARDDVLVPSTMSEQIAAAIPASSLSIAAWGAHAVNVTEPAWFNSVLLDFLEGQTGRDR